MKLPLRDSLAKKHDKWDRIESLMEHDEEAFKKEPFCIRLPNETIAAYKERCKNYAIGFINPTQDLVTAPGNAIFRNGSTLEFDNPTGYLATFTENVTLGNEKTPYIRFLRDHVSVGIRAYGTVFTVIDKPREIFQSKQDERAKGMPYLSNIRPQDVLNYAIVGGEMVWFAWQSTEGDAWVDPMQNRPVDKPVIKILTRDKYIVTDLGGSIRHQLDHSFGIVPVVIQGSFLPHPSDVLGVSAFEQTSSMLISYNHYLNLAGHELNKHGSSLLLMHIEAITPENQDIDKAGNTELKIQQKGKTLQWDGTQEPKYLVKDLVVNDHMHQAEYYLDMALKNERDLRSVGKKGVDGRDLVESGISKLIERDPLEANLISLADDLEIYTDKVFGIINTMMNAGDTYTFEFDKDFDMRGFEQKLDEIKKAMEIGYERFTPTGFKELLKNTKPHVTNDQDTQEIIDAEIDAAPLQSSDEQLEQQINQEMENENTI